MLELDQHISGCPPDGLHYLVLPTETLLVCSLSLPKNLTLTWIIQLYPSKDALVVLNSQSLALIKVMAFWEAFPGHFGTHEHISSMSVDSGMKLVRLRVLPACSGCLPERFQVFAAMNSRVAVWAVSGSPSAGWRVHSSLILPPDHVITTLDSRSGTRAFISS
jgi:hypothetical protein